MAATTDDLFAQYVIEAGICEAEQIEQARQAQELAAKRGVLFSLPDALVADGALTSSQRENIEKKLQAQQQGGIQQLGNFKLLKKLGEGAMGEVYLAEDTLAQRKVALKVLPKKHSEDTEFIKRFRREAKAVGKLNHVNIVSAYSVGEEMGNHFYVMEYCEGEPLDKMLKREEAIPSNKALEIVMQIARGLKHAHEHNIIHRDIKPANIFITADGVAKILDLGLAKEIGPGENTFNTKSGMALGTPHYISPEQARGEKVIDGRTDIYSLGATFYHLITGQTPFQGSTAAMIILKHLNDQLTNPQDIREDIPDDVVHVIQRMMAKEPGDRYRDCKELLADLELVIDGRAPSSHAIEWPKSSVAMRLRPPAPRRMGTARQQPVMAVRAQEPKVHLAEQRKAEGPASGRQKAEDKSSFDRSILVVAGGVCVLAIGLVAVIFRGQDSDNSSPAVSTATAKPADPLQSPSTKTAVNVPAVVPKEIRTVPSPNTTAKADKELEEQRNQRAAMLLEQANALRDDPWAYRARLTELSGAYGSTPAGQEAVRLLKSLKVPEGNRPPPQDAAEFQGHRYKIFRERISWHDARRKCEELGGHLATITSKEEDEFVANIAANLISNAVNYDGLCLGATDEAHEGQWIWITGEPFGYTNWCAGEPSNKGEGGAAENYLSLIVSKRTWNDITPTASGILGFICEWEPTGSAASANVAIANTENRQEKPVILPDSTWSILHPTSASSSGGSTLTATPDGTIIASGQNPDNDTYTVSSQLSGEVITKIRIEVFSDNSLPNGGPGRCDSGNFVLTRFTVEADGKQIELLNPKADFEQHTPDGSYVLASALLGKKDTGWAIHPNEGKPHFATFDFAAPLQARQLNIAIEQNSKFNKHNIGRLRLSVARDPAVLKAAARIQYAQFAAEFDALLFKNDIKSALARLDEAKADPKLEPARQALELDREFAGYAENLNAASKSGAEKLNDQRPFTFRKADGKDLSVGKGSGNSFQGIKDGVVLIEQTVGAGKATVRLSLAQLAPSARYELAALGLPSTAESQLKLAYADTLLIENSPGDITLAQIRNHLESARKGQIPAEKIEHISERILVIEREIAAEKAVKATAGLLKEDKWQEAVAAIQDLQTKFADTRALSRLMPGLKELLAKYGKPGLLATAFNFSGKAEELNEATPNRIGEKIVEIINFPTKESLHERFGHDTNIGIIFRGQIHIPKDGEYTFYLYSDDSSILTIDDKAVAAVPDWGKEISGTVSLKSGVHTLGLKYQQATGPAALTLKWSGPDLPKNLVPPAAFSHKPTAALPK